MISNFDNSCSGPTKPIPNLGDQYVQNDSPQVSTTKNGKRVVRDRNLTLQYIYITYSTGMSLIIDKFNGSIKILMTPKTQGHERRVIVISPLNFLGEELRLLGGIPFRGLFVVSRSVFW